MTMPKITLTSAKAVWAMTGAELVSSASLAMINDLQRIDELFCPFRLRLGMDSSVPFLVSLLRITISDEMALE